jgi:hypothetical protein
MKWCLEKISNWAGKAWYEQTLWLITAIKSFIGMAPGVSRSSTRTLDLRVMRRALYHCAPAAGYIIGTTNIGLHTGMGETPISINLKIFVH